MCARTKFVMLNTEPQCLKYLTRQLINLILSLSFFSAKILHLSALPKIKGKPPDRRLQYHIGNMCLKDEISDGEILRRGFSSGFEGIFFQDDGHFLSMVVRRLGCFNFALFHRHVITDDQTRSITN